MQGYLVPGIHVLGTACLSYFSNVTRDKNVQCSQIILLLHDDMKSLEYIFLVTFLSQASSNVLLLPSVAAFSVNSCWGVGRPNHKSHFDQSLRLSPSKEVDKDHNKRSIKLSGSGRTVSLVSRTLPISPDWRLTVWEWEHPAQVVESFWEAQSRGPELRGGVHSSRLLDPFGLVSWPGSVVAAQELRKHALVVQDKSVFIWGAGVGVEAQAVAELGAKSILATDIHPTTLQQLELGIMENDRIPNKGIIQTQIFDLMAETPFPTLSADLVVVADVLYNEQLASHVVRRVVEYWKHNPELKVLITDSQRFVDIMKGLQDGFSKAIVNDNTGQEKGIPLIHCTEETLVAFTGSGVCINEDQTYDVKVRKIWIGLSE